MPKGPIGAKLQILFCISILIANQNAQGELESHLARAKW